MKTFLKVGYISLIYELDLLYIASNFFEHLCLIPQEKKKKHNKKVITTYYKLLPHSWKRKEISLRVNGFIIKCVICLHERFGNTDVISMIL